MALHENTQEPVLYSVTIVMFDKLFPDDEKPPNEQELERAIHHGLGEQGVIPAQVIVKSAPFNPEEGR